MSLMPILAKPVTRPHFVRPETCVNLENGDPLYIFRNYMKIVRGANYNDPTPFGPPSYQRVMHSAVPFRR